MLVGIRARNCSEISISFVNPFSVTSMESWASALTLGKSPTIYHS